MASRLVVQWCPPALRAAANRVLGSHTRYLGPFAHWSEAASEATGYDDGAIVQRVEEATRRVLSGETGYEQDGVVRDGHAPPTYALPALLLADEPTGNLDPGTAARVMELLVAQTRTHGASLVLVTHSDAAAARADRVLRLTAQGIASSV